MGEWLICFVVDSNCEIEIVSSKTDPKIFLGSATVSLDREERQSWDSPRWEDARWQQNLAGWRAKRR